MKKLKVQRLVKVWVEDIYNVDEINEYTVDAAINYELDCEESETFWETLIDLGPVEVFDENNSLITYG